MKYKPYSDPKDAAEGARVIKQLIQRHWHLDSVGLSNCRAAQEVLRELNEQLLIQSAALANANFDPNEPRDGHGQWTTNATGIVTNRPAHANTRHRPEDPDTKDTTTKPKTSGTAGGTKPATAPSAEKIALSTDEPALMLERLLLAETLGAEEPGFNKAEALKSIRALGALIYNRAHAEQLGFTSFHYPTNLVDVIKEKGQFAGFEHYNPKDPNGGLSHGKLHVIDVCMQGANDPKDKRNYANYLAVVKQVKATVQNIIKGTVDDPFSPCFTFAMKTGGHGHTGPGGSFQFSGNAAGNNFLRITRPETEIPSAPFMKNAAFLLLFTLPLAGCVRDKLVVTSRFRSPRIQRELNYYVANFSSHETNHFYVGATWLDHGKLVEAEVYWKEERTLLRYAELEPDSWADMAAWPTRYELKLDRDTVDTQEEANTSSYEETHRTWVDWMEQCVKNGKLYCVLKSEALRVAPSGKPPEEGSITRRAFPPQSAPQTDANWQYNGSPISAVDIMTKSSDIAAALSGKTRKETNSAAPMGVKAQKAYRDEILSIEQKAGHLVAADDLFGDTNFIAFYEHPVDCASNATLFLKSVENPEDAKMIVVYSLQRLPLPRYVEFEGELIDMAASRQISSNLLNRAIFPGLEWSSKIQKNFTDQKVKALIAKIKKCPQIDSNNRAYLKEIASGKARQDILEYESAGILSAKQSEQ